MSDDLQDEETSITAIYGPEVLQQIPGESHLYTLKFASCPSVSFRIDFPTNYPDAPPSVLGTQSVGDRLAKGDGAYLVELVREVLAEVYTPGAPCIFDLVEEVNARLQGLGLDERDGTESDAAEGDHAMIDGNVDAIALHNDDDDNANDTAASPPWTLSTPITEKKSLFLARCAPVTSVAQAKSYLAHLLRTDKRAAKATHNISAWRIRGASEGVRYQDCDDDGETAAGGRLLHLLELMEAWDVMVVVSRWYGGVQLGPDRFRIINSTAREAVVRAGFGKDGGGSSNDGKGKKGKK